MAEIQQQLQSNDMELQVKRNQFLYQLMWNIHSKIRKVSDLINIYGVDITDENYRIISNATAYYFISWNGEEEQDYEKVINFLKMKKFHLNGYRSQTKNPDGTFSFSNPMEEFTMLFLTSEQTTK
jgi:hypothetical protein